MAGKLTDPQYAVDRQVRIPVAVVITLQNEGVVFRRSDGVPCGTLTREELSRSCLHDWVSIAKIRLVNRCGEGGRGICSRLIRILGPESSANEMSDHLYFRGCGRGRSCQYEGYRS